MKRITLLIAALLAFSLCASSCSKAGDPSVSGEAAGSALTVASGDSNIAVSEIDLSATPILISTENLAYLPLGSVITVDFGGLAPVSAELRDYVLSENGSLLYQTSDGGELYATPDFTLSDGSLTFALPFNYAVLFSSNSADYEKGAVRRGFIVTLELSDNSSVSYSFALSTDASANENPSNTAEALKNTVVTLSGTTDGASEFAAAYNSINLEEPITADQFVNITPGSMSGSSYSIFKNALDCSSYVFDGSTYVQLGKYYGGVGITSVARCSFSGGDEFIYSYSFGVGSHTSYIGWFHDGIDETLNLTADGTELVLLKIDDCDFFVCSAALTDQASYSVFTLTVDDYLYRVIDGGEGAPLMVNVEK